MEGPRKYDSIVISGNVKYTTNITLRCRPYNTTGEKTTATARVVMPSEHGPSAAHGDALLVSSGFFRSLLFTATNIVAYAKVEPAQPRHHAGQRQPATGGFRRRRGRCVHGGVHPIISAISAYFFWQMPDDAGHEISGRSVVEISSRKGAAKAATKAASETTEDARDQRLG